jgi:3-methyladenine DNA glycosylase AlkC
VAAFKDELGVDAARRLGRELTRAWPEFPTRRFTAGLAAAIEPLELLARGSELTARLERTLPPRFSDAAGVLYRALESPTFTGWIVLPVGGFVASAGIDVPEQALPLLAALTPRWSSEFAIRPFIEGRRQITYRFLRDWVTADDEHVRRLVSEGTRPRLPWAPVLRDLVADPSPSLPLLERLVDDTSPYVRRSVANHLNDISKDHPGLAVDLARSWLPRGDHARWVVARGLRTLVKRGDRTALELIGATLANAPELVELEVDRKVIEVGDAVTFAFALRLAEGNEPVDAVIDYRVHYSGVRGLKAPKVFKLTRRRLEPGQLVTITRRHRFEHVSIRQIRPGPHRIDVQVNGEVVGSVDIEVIDHPA